MADLPRRPKYMRKAKENTISYQELEKKADQLVKEDKSSVSKSNRPCLPGLYEVERIIPSRRNGESAEFLVKWLGYDMASCTWEPRRNIPEDILRTLYINHNIDSQTIEAISMKWFHAVKKHLKSKSLDPMLRLEFRHDVYRYILHNKGLSSRLPGAILLQKEDFQRMMLPSSWSYILNKQGEGQCVEFPVRAKPVLKRSIQEFIISDSNDLVKAPVYIFEIVNFYVTKQPCSKDCLG